jgi:hypothetical protein
MDETVQWICNGNGRQQSSFARPLFSIQQKIQSRQLVMKLSIFGQRGALWRCKSITSDSFSPYSLFARTAAPSKHLDNVQTQPRKKYLAVPEEYVRRLEEESVYSELFDAYERERLLQENRWICGEDGEEVLSATWCREPMDVED